MNQPPRSLNPLDPFPTPYAVGLEQEKNRHKGEGKDFLHASGKVMIEVRSAEILQNADYDTSHDGPRHGVEPAQHHRR